MKRLIDLFLALITGLFFMLPFFLVAIVVRLTSIGPIR